MDAFANDTHEHRDEAFGQAASELGFAKATVEKDFRVCWSLQHLFALPSFGDHLIFKGGTSLSKAYDVIRRFSEDVDLSLDRTQLGFEGDAIQRTLTSLAANANLCCKIFRMPPRPQSPGPCLKR